MLDFNWKERELRNLNMITDQEFTEQLYTYYYIYNLLCVFDVLWIFKLYNCNRHPVVYIYTRMYNPQVFTSTTTNQQRESSPLTNTTSIQRMLRLSSLSRPNAEWLQEYHKL